MMEQIEKSGCLSVCNKEWCKIQLTEHECEVSYD